MLILDYPRRTDTDRPSIVVPPFHTGHLGLVPGSPIYVGARSKQATDENPVHLEVVVSPFDQDFRNLARLTATLKDDIGVVDQLLRAIASLQINVEIEDSSSIDRLDNHSVNLFLDLATSSLSDQPETTPEVTQQLYREYQSLFPVHDLRYLEIFDAVVLRCGDILTWKQVLGTELPDLQIQPLASKGLDRPQPARVSHRANRPYEVEIQLPNKMADRLRRELRNESSDLATSWYIFLSDTENRTLRAYFLRDSVRSRVLQVGLYHDDVPGALEGVLGLLKEAKFNIITSLVRKHTEDQNLLEAVLEYRGDESLPDVDLPRPSSDHFWSRLLPWVRDRLAAAHASSGRPLQSDVEVGPPKYPAFYGRTESVTEDGEVVRRTLSVAKAEPSGSPPEQLSRDDLLREQRTKLMALPSRIATPLDRLLDTVSRRDTSRVPSVFLSFPASAAVHGAYVKSALGKLSLEVDLYQKSGAGEMVIEHICEKIRAADLFIGIWREDRLEVPSAPRLSPWMLFEWGVATEADKEWMIVRSTALPDDVWSRIDTSRASPTFEDVTFERETVPLIAQFCIERLGLEIG